MSFVEGVVTAADEDGPVPPVLLSVVLTESSGEVLGFPDIAGNALDRIRVVTKEKVDPVAVSLFAVKETIEGCAGATEDVARPPRDVRGRDASWLPVNEEELDVFSAHEVSSFQGR